MDTPRGANIFETVLVRLVTEYLKAYLASLPPDQEITLATVIALASSATAYGITAHKLDPVWAEATLSEYQRVSTSGALGELLHMNGETLRRQFEQGVRGWIERHPAPTLRINQE